jgi:SAM-dependent methyltransferase
MEIVTPGCGTLTPQDPAALAAALAEYIDDGAKRRAAAEAGPARARELCDVALRTRELVTEVARLVEEPSAIDAGSRASRSEGSRRKAILSVVRDALLERGQGRSFDAIVDIGCGRGDSARELYGMYRHLIGCDDAARGAGFPRADSVEFRCVELEKVPYPLDSDSADVVVSVGTIDRLENPRALAREMARVVKRGGWVVVTTRNSLSLASKVRLVVRNEFHEGQGVPGRHPDRARVLVEEDLKRIARECGLADVDIRYTPDARIPLTSLRWPRHAALRGRWISDDVVMIARRT